MPMKFKKGAQVVQVVKPIEGEIVNVAIVDDVVQYEVAFTGEDGEPHARFFTEEQLDHSPEKIDSEAPTED